MKKILAAVAASSMMIGGAHAASIVIDEFDQTLAVGVSLSGMAEAVSGGDVYVSPSATFNRTISVSSTMSLNDNVFIGSDSLTVNSGNLGNVVGSIRWELADTTGGLDVLGATFRAGIENGSVSSSDDEVNMTLTLISGIGGTEVSETVSFTINQGDAALAVKTSAFSLVDLTDIDAIVLGYTSDEFEGVDFTLTDALIANVPVPGALPLMLAGMGFFAARRTRRS